MITWSQAKAQSKSQANDSTTTGGDFLEFWMNHYYKEILADFGRAQTEKKKTATSVASQQGYQVPPDCLWPKSVTYTVSSNVYVLEEINDQETWDNFNRQTQTGVPTHFFFRPRFGIQGGEIQLWPIPSAASQTINFIFEAGDRDLGADSYASGTVALTSGSATVTGTTTNFTTSMVGRYFRSNDTLSDGLWYKIASFNSTTSLILENVYEGSTSSGGTYQIDEIFNLPEEMQVLPMYGALGEYYSLKINIEQEAKYFGKYNSGLEKAKIRYGTKTRSNIVRSNHGRYRSTYPSNFPASIS